MHPLEALSDKDLTRVVAERIFDAIRKESSSWRFGDGRIVRDLIWRPCERRELAMDVVDAASSRFNQPGRFAQVFGQHLEALTRAQTVDPSLRAYVLATASPRSLILAALLALDAA